ncbi:hypothetical protein AwDysgo_21140 [Bacteroidales bacterium]|nr:hypothetical protein AwDysgo_21140 [Bacteroidales bacterium]
MSEENVRLIGEAAASDASHQADKESEEKCCCKKIPRRIVSKLMFWLCLGLCLVGLSWIIWACKIDCGKGFSGLALIAHSVYLLVFGSLLIVLLRSLTHHNKLEEANNDLVLKMKWETFQYNLKAKEAADTKLTKLEKSIDEMKIEISGLSKKDNATQSLFYLQALSLSSHKEPLSGKELIDKIKEIRDTFDKLNT